MWNLRGRWRVKVKGWGKKHGMPLGTPKTPNMKLFAWKYIVIRADNSQGGFNTLKTYNELNKTTVGSGPFLREYGMR